MLAHPSLAVDVIHLS